MKILFAMDASPASQTALDEMGARPWPAGSSVQVLSVIEPSHFWTNSDTADQDPRRITEVIEIAVQRLRAAGLDAAADIAEGDAKTVILDRAQSGDIDLVVVGSHGSSALTRFLLGNVASAVLRYAPCSIEIVRGPNAAKILLATDGSPSSELAAQSIAQRPWPAGTEVRVLNVVELILPTTRALLEPPFVDAALMETLREEAMKKSQEAVDSAKQLLASSGLDVSESISVLLPGAKAVILDEATQWGAGLIVLGSHGLRGMDRFLLGSVSEAVALHATCSVEVIRRRIMPSAD